MYTVRYGTDMLTLSDSSEVIMGNTNLSTINELFSIIITGLTPFTTYYYIISANNSVGTTNTSVMNFKTDESGVVTFHAIVLVFIVITVVVHTYTAPTIAPRNFRNISTTATSITFQWDNLTVREANGIVRSFTVTCTRGDLFIMVSLHKKRISLL